jgi:hypothetical protein
MERRVFFARLNEKRYVRIGIFPEREEVLVTQRLSESSNRTPSVFCNAVRMLERLAAEGLPFGPSMRIRLLAGICARRSRSGNPTVALT